MPVERLRLRPWLEQTIDAGATPGLSWVDREKRVFKVSWKHASRHGWSVDKDACLFRDWAEHTGRYRDGLDRPDPRRWKANFRCALNALPDIIEIPSRGQTRGRDAFKVYRICKKVDKKVQESRVNTTKRSANDIPRVPEEKKMKTCEEEKEKTELESKERVEKPFYAYPKPPFEANPFLGYPAFSAYLRAAVQSFSHLPRDHDYISSYYDQSGRPEMKDIGVMTYSSTCPGVKQEPLSPVDLAPSCSKGYEQSHISSVTTGINIEVKEEDLDTIPSDQEIIDIVDQLSQSSSSSSSYDDLDDISDSAPDSPVTICPQLSTHGQTLDLKPEKGVSSYSSPFFPHPTLASLPKDPTLAML